MKLPIMCGLGGTKHVFVGKDIGLGALQVYDEYRQAYGGDFGGQASAWIYNKIKEVWEDVQNK
jgi:hypothetical protein